MSADKIYQQVAAYLKQSIASGELKIGDAIYSENLLCEKLGVSRTSVRKAIRLRRIFWSAVRERELSSRGTAAECCTMRSVWSIIIPGRCVTM